MSGRMSNHVKRNKFAPLVEAFGQPEDFEVIRVGDVWRVAKLDRDGIPVVNRKIPGVNNVQEIPVMLRAINAFKETLPQPKASKG